MMKYVAALAVLALAPAARGSEPLEMKKTQPGQAKGERTATVKVKVKAVDLTKRILTVQGQDGTVQAFKVGPEVERLDEIAPGDTIVLKYKQGLMLQVMAPQEERQPAGAATAVQGRPDIPPSGAMAATVSGTVTVAAVDQKSRIVVLQTEAGDLFKVKADPQIQLEKLKAGDKLFGTYTQSLAVSVQKASSVGPAKTN